jgi:hypothetical protein
VPTDAMATRAVARRLVLGVLVVHLVSFSR